MYSLNVLGKSRIEYLLFDDICALNLNALINKFTFNPILLTAALDELGKSYPIINLCGFAMLCYRLNIPYGSSRSVALAQNIKNFFTKYYPNFSFCQKEIEFDGAVDLRPISHLWFVDHNNEVIYCNKMLIDKLDFLGFASNQIVKLLLDVKELSEILPADIVAQLPIECEYTLEGYHKICEVLKC